MMIFEQRYQKKLQDSQKMKSLHGSTNPYIPKNLRVGWDVAAKDVLDKIGTHL